LKSEGRSCISKKILVEINQVLKDDFLFVLKSLAVLVLIVEPIKSFSNNHCEEISDFSPDVTVNFPARCNAFENLNFGDFYVHELSLEFFFFGLFLTFEGGKFPALFNHGNFFLDQFV
jgi:hypothetical protein